jgi:2-dehydro-3-deoxygalactonokinase
LPFAIDGGGAIVEDFIATAEFRHPVKIISGASSGRDIMRGEETQMIGLAAMDSELLAGPPSVCIFPGTHSKHVKVENGRIVDFTTFMTGELFDVLRRHTILKDSVEEELHNGELTSLGEDAFRNGVLASGKSNLLHTFFSVRVDQLFERITKADNLFYLSGLLIGTELRTLCDDGVRIRLCSGSSVYNLYQLALHVLGLTEQTLFIAPEIMVRSAMEGHISIFKKSIA